MLKCIYFVIDLHNAVSRRRLWGTSDSSITKHTMTLVRPQIILLFMVHSSDQTLTFLPHVLLKFWNVFSRENYVNICIVSDIFSTLLCHLMIVSSNVVYACFFTSRGLAIRLPLIRASDWEILNITPQIFKCHLNFYSFTNIVGKVGFPCLIMHGVRFPNFKRFSLWMNLITKIELKT